MVILVVNINDFFSREQCFLTCFHKCFTICILLAIENIGTGLIAAKNLHIILYILTLL